MACRSATSAIAIEYPSTALPTNAAPFPSPPMAVGSGKRYQSVLVFWSSICVAAAATPKRKAPMPDDAAIDPIGGYAMSGGPEGAFELEEHASAHAASEATARGRRIIGASPPLSPAPRRTQATSR